MRHWQTRDAPTNANLAYLESLARPWRGMTVEHFMDKLRGTIGIQRMLPKAVKRHFDLPFLYIGNSAYDWSPERLAEEAARLCDALGAGLDAVVSALQRNQVDTMLIVDDPSADGELWVGPEPTEIATDPAQLSGMSVADPQRVRADAALLRALIGTDADLTVLAPEEAPELTDGVGAVLRYVDASTPGRGNG